MKTKTKSFAFEYGITSEMNTGELINNQDLACFDEIHQILKKHQALNRFGVTLLNNEKLPENLITVETNSIKDRILLTQTINKNNLSSQKSIETNWRLNTFSAVAACVSTCVASPADHNFIHKETSNDNE